MPTTPTPATHPALTPAVLTRLAERVGELVAAGTREQLAQEVKALSEQFSERLRQLEPALRAELLEGKPGTSTVYDAYLLGQLAFAQLLVSTFALQRPQEEFYAVLQDAQYRPVLALLGSRELSTQELAEGTGLPAATVESMLQKMRGLGISEFRGGRACILNFLTPAALSMLGEDGLRAPASLKP